MLDHDGSGEQATRIVQKKLREMVGYCETAGCRRQFLLAYFGERVVRENCGLCTICTRESPVTERKARARRTPKRFGSAAPAGFTLSRRTYPIPSV
jgi:ATP-dependent DNA helicase RecQ